MDPSETPPAPEDSQNSLDLEGFLNPEPAEGLSIEDLGRAYAELMDQGDDPYEQRQADHELAELQDLVDSEKVNDDESLEVTPRSILEAMLFVGHADNQPLTARVIASFMRGVTPEEIDELVVELNSTYDDEGTPYYVVAEAGGYRMALRPSYHSIRDRFYGRIKEARLSQAAIDVLSIVAYRQPMTRDEVDELRGHPSGSLLSQLVRRRLLQLEPKSPDRPKPTYLTTERFLKLFALNDLADLPQSEDLDRWTG
jgi:segregation and condensation protein B